MRRELIALLSVGVFALVPMAAPVLGAYVDPNLLSVEKAPGDILATYSIDQLKTEFPNQTYATRTPWTGEGETTTFRGPLFKSILAKHGFDAKSAVQVIAYDNFVSEIRLDEINNYSPILAVERQCTGKDRRGGQCQGGQDFRPITLRESGPIFIVWPYDQLPNDYVPARNSIWVWFVVALRPVP